LLSADTATEHAVVRRLIHTSSSSSKASIGEARRLAPGRQSCLDEREKRHLGLVAIHRIFDLLGCSAREPSTPHKLPKRQARRDLSTGSVHLEALGLMRCAI
jgi:hypothetical protein